MIERLIREHVKKIPPYVAGKSKEEIAKGYGLKANEIVKLASNENPLGTSKKVIEEIIRYLSKISVYPDIEARELRAEISRYIGAKERQIIVGNGSDEIIDLMVKLFVEPGEEVVIPIPTFSVYAASTQTYSGKPVFVPLLKDFKFDIKGILDKINKKTKLVFICSPNNPSGNVIPEGDLRRLLESEVIVLLDEAYAEFSDNSYVGLVNEYENLVVSRTFSKAFGLAGLRVGYGIASKKVIKYMLRIKIPFNVNLLAQKAALAALRDREHLKKSIQMVKKGREFLFNELSKIRDIQVYPSRANFLLFSVEDTGKTSKEIVEELFKRGVITRDCSSFKGLGDRFIRVSIGTMEENRRFLECLKDVLEA
jgi:histidinol-phosphate aminotransferase